MTEAMRKVAEEIVYRFGVENTEEDFEDCVSDVARIVTSHINAAGVNQKGQS